MPQMFLRTVGSIQVWASPDGQRKIFELDMIYEGKPVKAKTYSSAIATVGWEGEVMTYEKSGNNGPETFVKQPPKDDGQFSSGQTAQGATAQNAYTQRDDSHIKAQMAIKAAVQIGGVADVTNDLEMAKYLSGIENAAREIFAM